jgi:hypothetical protein
MLDYIVHEGKTLSIIIRANYKSNDIEFFTPDDFPQQLAYMNRKQGYSISPHVHNAVERQVSDTQEVLYIKSGAVRVDYYDNDKKYLESRLLAPGDVVLLAYGGHGFYMCEDSEIIEVKQGPYAGGMDKTRFESIKSDQVRIKD